MRRRPDQYRVRVQDVGLLGEDDPTILSWIVTVAAIEGIIAITTINEIKR